MCFDRNAASPLSSLTLHVQMAARRLAEMNAAADEGKYSKSIQAMAYHVVSKLHEELLPQSL